MRSIGLREIALEGQNTELFVMNDREEVLRIVGTNGQEAISVLGGVGCFGMGEGYSLWIACPEAERLFQDT